MEKINEGNGDQSPQTPVNNEYAANLNEYKYFSSKYLRQQLKQKMSVDSTIQYSNLVQYF
jgi:hypothetical protein